jgi:hypothetical protein
MAMPKCSSIDWLHHSHWRNLIKRRIPQQVPVAHDCNPSYSGGRDQEDDGSKPAWANSLRDPILKKTHHNKRACGEGPKFKHQYCKKKKKKKDGFPSSILRDSD